MHAHTAFSWEAIPQRLCQGTEYTQLWLSEIGHFCAHFLIDYSKDKCSNDSSQEKQKQLSLILSNQIRMWWKFGSWSWWWCCVKTHSCLWTLGQNESRLFPAIMCILPKKDTAPALPGHPGLLPGQTWWLRTGSKARNAAQSNQRRVGWSGTNWEECGYKLGKLSGESPILFFQYSSQQEDQDRRFSPAPD